jgi:hypothetical protein
MGFVNKAGVLLHVYHLGSEDWERLVWGDPARNELGVGAKLLEYFLSVPPTTTVQTVLYNGPSQRDGVPEGEYTLRFLKRKVPELRHFPKLRTLYDALQPAEIEAFELRLREIRIGGSIADTYDEIRRAAAYFADRHIWQVVHIAAATHAPRCIQLQAKVRENGLLPAQQLWYTVASDRSFAGRTATDVVVVEPPHRADDPLLHHDPTLASLVRRHYSLTAEGKKRFIADVQQSLDKLYADPAMASTSHNSATK